MGLQGTEADNEAALPTCKDTPTLYHATPTPCHATPNPLLTTGLLHFQGNYEAMVACYRQLLTYIKGAVTRNYSEKSINSILDYISTSSNVSARPHRTASHTLPHPCPTPSSSCWRSCTAPLWRHCGRRVTRDCGLRLTLRCGGCPGDG